MAEVVELLRQGRNEEAWQKCCGFIDLSLDDFMKIQKRLLLEQLELLKHCEIGHYILNGTNPGSVEEFRESILPNQLTRRIRAETEGCLRRSV